MLDMLPAEQKHEIFKVMCAEHEQILRSVKPKEKGLRESGVDITSDAPEDAPVFSESDLSEKRIIELERDVDRCINDMQALHQQAQYIPRMVAELSRRRGKPMQPMPKAAQHAIGTVGILQTTKSRTNDSNQSQSVSTFVAHQNPLHV